MTTTVSKYKVMKSNAGYYVGTGYSDPDIGCMEPILPNSRDSDYFRTHEDAEKYLIEMFSEDEIELTKEEKKMKTLRDAISEVASSTQLGMLELHMDEIIRLYNSGESEFTSIQGIGKKLNEVIVHAVDLMGQYSASLLEEQLRDGEFDDEYPTEEELQQMERDMEDEMQRDFDIENEFRKAMEALTKALRGCHVKVKITTAVLIQVSPSGRIQDPKFDQWYSKRGWTTDIKKASMCSTLSRAKEVMKSIAETYATYLSKATKGQKVDMPYVKLYILTMEDGKAVSRKAKPFMVWNAVTRKTEHVVDTLPVVGELV